MTTTETVSVDGVVLNTLAYNIETLSGREGIPAKRGENSSVAYRHGKRWKRKFFEEKTETWAMWVRGCDEDGLVPAYGDRAEFNANLQMLKQLFGKIDSELVLQRKIEMPSGLLTLNARGECTGTMDPQIVGNRPTLARFTADVLMADPFWYAAAVAVNVSLAGLTVDNPGTTPTDRMTIRFNGPCTNPRLTNTTRGLYVQYTGTLASGEYVELDVREFLATKKSDSNIYTNAVGSVEHGGSIPWFELGPGDNVLEFNSGNVDVTYYPAYL